MIVRTAKITRRIIAAADRLKVIARHGAGYDGVDLEAAKEKGFIQGFRYAVMLMREITVKL